MKKNLFIFVLIVGCVIPYFTSAQTDKHLLTWEVSYTDKISDLPQKWIPAMIPGAVQLDIARAEKYEPFYYAEHWKDYTWMEDKFYTYRAVFKRPLLKEGEREFFVSKGIDYEFDIIVNGEKIFNQEGMFTWVHLDITEYLKEKNEILVKIYPAPKRYAQPADRSQASASVKPAVSYGWDWHPRLIPLGIWDDTYIQNEPTVQADDVAVNYELSPDFSYADITLVVKGKSLNGCNYRWSLKDNSGQTVAKLEGKNGSETITGKTTIKNPQLWWPHDQGTPYLYTSTLQLIDSRENVIQSEASQIGFRRVRLVMNEGAWNEPYGFPKSRSVPPVQFEINGRKIFCKGTNWVNPEIFPGTITRDRYNELLNLAKEANFNILRVWGGAIVNKESFFELCDEKGILVWQEFPLACNNYPDEAHYLSILEQEATSIILRVKKHPSLALWCGGNELLNNWSGMTDQSLPLRLLNSLCLNLDPNTPFLPTSPVMGMAHGHYVFRDWDSREEVFQEMSRSHYTAYTEFGMPSPASVEILKTIIPQEQLWPPKPGTSWESHGGYKAWVNNTWLCQDIIEDYFGPSRSLGELVANGQLLQCEGYKCIFEEARRQKPYCSIAANWCYNEPWPTAANNSILSYPAVPKPAYYAVKNACRPLLASAKFNKYKWTEGEEFSAEIWMLNDLPKEVSSGKVTIKLVAANDEKTILVWDFDPLKSNTNLSGPIVRYKLPAWKTDRFSVVLEVDGHPELNSVYTLVYRPKTVEMIRTTPQLNQ